jgi:plastocyanin
MKSVIALAGAAALVAAVPATAPSATKRTPQKRTVKVEDNYFSPKKLTVNRGSTITWKWGADAADIHDVLLKSRPKGVRRFESGAAGTPFTYRRKLTRPGLYKLVCTFHETEMRMEIRVRR